MTVKKKRMFSKILCLFLALLMLLGPISSVVFAMDQSADANDALKDYNNNWTGSYDGPLPDRLVDFNSQGYRIYVAKAYYNADGSLNEALTHIVPNAYGTTCLDFMIGNLTSWVGRTFSCEVRQALMQGGNSTKCLNFDELLGMAKNPKNNASLYRAALNRVKLNGTNIKEMISGDSNESVIDAVTGESRQKNMMEAIVEKYYPSNVINEVLYSSENISEYSGTTASYVMFVENTFKIPVVKANTDFYGTVYEWGCKLQTEGSAYDPVNASYEYMALFCSAIYGQKNQLGADFFGSLGLDETDIRYRDPVKDFKNMETPPTSRTDGWWSAGKEQIFKRLGSTFYDYGVMIFRINGGPIVKEDTEPDAIVVTKPNLPTVVTTDISIMTGWEATEGLYDISYGQNSGIPTTEFLTNSIIAQDSDLYVEYAPSGEVQSPDGDPIVTYNLTYYEHDNRFHYHYDDDKNNPIYDEAGKVIGYKQKKVYEDCRCERTHQFTIPIIRHASFYYIKDYAVYSLKSASVESAATASYNFSDTLTEKDVNVRVYAEEKNVPDKTSYVSINDEMGYVLNPEKVGYNRDAHVDWTDVKDLSFTNVDIGKGVFGSFAEAQNWFNSNGFNFANERVGYPIVRNDRLEVDGIVYLDDTKITGKENTNGNWVTTTKAPDENFKPTIVKEEIEVQIPYAVENGKYYSTLTAIYDKIAGNGSATIFNWTSSDSDHSHIIQTGNSVANKLQAMRGDNSIRTSTTLKNGVSKTFVQNDPMMIITPVIAATTVHNPKLTDEQRATMTEEEIHEWETLYGTQMPKNRITDANQLRLDESYKITFDAYRFFQWVEGGSSNISDRNTVNDYLINNPFDDPPTLGYDDSDDTSDNGNEWHGRENYETDNKYDKYVLSKYVKFPFDVYIDDILFEKNRWICLYSYDPASNTTTAGNTKDNHLKEFTFYIPPWADETRGNIDFLVYAINEEGIDLTNDGRGNNRVQSFHGTLNGNEAYTFCANYAIDVQTSGWAYDFRVVGVNDINYAEDPENRPMWGEKTSLAEVSDEFFSGIYNRTGKDGDSFDSVQKRLKNLALVQLQEEKADRTESIYTEQKDTLPMDSPASEKKFGILAGALSQGSDISFSFKTMGNLTTKDKVLIKPTFTYYPIEYFNSYDESTDTYDESLKVEHEDLLIYYNTTDEKYIRAGSDRDEYITTYLYDEEFDNSKVKEDVIYTAEKLVLDPMDFIMEKHEVSNMEWIEIEGDELMLYDTRALAQLERNQGLKESFFIDILGSDFDMSYVSSVEAKKKELTESIQTWCGSYRIPSKMKITTKQKLAQAAITNPETGNVHVPADLTDYALHAGGITGLEDFWIADDGFLVLNFNIYVYKDNGGDKYVPWLLYNDGESNAWELQGQKEKVNIWANSASINKWHNTAEVWDEETIYEGLFQIDTVPGDIAIINLAADNGSGVHTELVFTN